MNETRETLTIFDGDSPTQDWYYRVRDMGLADIGTLTAVELRIYYDTAADLELLNLTATRPAEPSARTFTACGFDVRNNGPSALSAEALTLDYYLSDDLVFGDADDRRIGDSVAIMTLAAGATAHIDLDDGSLSSMVREWTLVLMPAGDYYVFANVTIAGPPPSDPVPGNDFDRTATAFAYDPKLADLELLNLTAARPAEPSARTFTACGFDLKNNGPSALSADSIMVDCYLSKNTAFGDGDDRKIGDTGFPFTLAAGSTAHINFNTADLNGMVREWTAGLVPTGDYYLFVSIRLISQPPNDPETGNDYGRTGAAFPYVGSGMPWLPLLLGKPPPGD